jgi:2,5-diketo-D-gluconate reductase A
MGVGMAIDSAPRADVGARREAPGTPARTVALPSGYDMPLLGMGTWPLSDQQAATSVARAIGLGYRLIDTGASYGNEAGVGRGLRESGVARSELFVSTKLRGSEQGYRATKRALRGSLDRLGLDYVDLYLVHWPLSRLNRYVESFQAMLELADEGLVRSVGVANFKAAHIERLVAETGAWPAVDQLQLSPALVRTELRDFLTCRDIRAEAWNPLGQADHLVGNPLIAGLAQRYATTAERVILRWHVQQGIVAVPKASDALRQAANLGVFDFELSAADMARLGGLDRGESAALDSDTYEEF